uniref:Nonstructural protein n=1 Tax=Grus japonensis Chaphamaparvovirus TaxID=2794490 RepID=A0A8A4XC93_9VIRU|nr:MAG: nonstructural protein [Grus japonensis Chaphamaparvovirus]
MSTENTAHTSRYGDSRSDPTSSTTRDIQYSNYTGIRVGRGNNWSRYQAETLPEVDAQYLINSYSMSQWVCGVTIVKENNIELQSSYKFLELIDSCNIGDEFMVVGENSDKNIFHTHFMLKTNSRVDSVKRTLLNAQHRLGIQLDICKLANCRYWLGMFSYLLKNPLMVYCSNRNIANLAYTLIENGSCLKYLNAKQEQTEQNVCKDIVKTINNIIDEHNCTTTEEIFVKGNDILLKYLHMSNLEQIMKNCLQYKTAQKQVWDPFSFKYAPEADARAIHNILRVQKIDCNEFDETFWKWLTRQNGKKNTIILIGPTNTGKTVFIRGLIQLVPSGSLVNTSSPFFAEGISGCKIGYWEEPLLTSENAEIFKQIAEGVQIMLPQKFKKPFNHPGCPIIITTNHPITRFCASEENAFKNRCITYHWYNCITSNSRICSNDCLNGNREQRRSTTCNIRWSPSSGNTIWESNTSYNRNSDWSSNNISQCGRWWCGSNNNKPCSYCARTKIECTDTRGLSSSTSTTISNNDRSSGREHETGGPSNRKRPRFAKPLLRSLEQSTNFIESISRRIRKGTGKRSDERLGPSGDRTDTGTSGESDSELLEIPSGREQYSTPQSDEESETETGNICTCIVEPLKADWQAYLCYLARKYD